LLANEARRASLAIDAVFGILSVAIAFWLLPKGPVPYLWALAIIGASSSVFGASLLLWTRAINLAGVARAIAPPLLSASIAILCLHGVDSILVGLWSPLEVIMHAICFGLAYLFTLFALFRRTASELILIVPGISELAQRVKFKKI